MSHFGSAGSVGAGLTSDGWIALRVRTLFAYEGQREVDLSFKENVAIVAHPAKDESSPWWYGMLVEEGRKGWFPHSYVEQMTGK